MPTANDETFMSSGISVESLVLLVLHENYEYEETWLNVNRFFSTTRKPDPRNISDSYKSAITAAGIVVSPSIGFIIIVKRAAVVQDFHSTILPSSRLGVYNRKYQVTSERRWSDLFRDSHIFGKRYTIS